MVTQQQRIIWTGLPNGVYQDASGQTYLRVSVHIAPRLYSTQAMEDLNTYPDFKNWPRLVSTMTFAVAFTSASTGVSTTIRARPDTTPLNGKPRPTPDVAYYESLFVSSTPVKPYIFQDLSKRFVISHPARMIQHFLQVGYSLIAVSAAPQGADNTLPHISSISNILNPHFPNADRGPFDSITDDEFRRGTYLKQLQLHYDQGAVPTPYQPGLPNQLPDPSQIQEHFKLLRFFHYRDGTKQDRLLPGQVPHQDEPDFHQALSALTKHPTLERYLGFVVDLLVPVDPAIPQAQDAYLQVHAKWHTASYPPSLNPPTNLPIEPRTHYIYDGGTTFTSRPLAAPIVNGMLDVSDSSTFGLAQIDVDGSGLKLAQFISSLGRSQYFLTSYEKATTGAIALQAGLPALRSTGFQLLEANRAVGLATAFTRSANANAQAESTTTPTDPDVYTEDITLGYRPDIFDSITHQWHSLVRRAATYTFLRSGQKLVIAEEGFVSLGATEDPADPSPTKSLYLHEAILRWNGWSLAVPMPGGFVQTGDNPSPLPAGPGSNFKLDVDWTYADDGTGKKYNYYSTLHLPRLRFGQSYRLRARAVDLAGNSLDPSVVDAAHAIPPAPQLPQPYYRWEPVQAPLLVPKDDIRLSPAESLERLVIRSDVGVSSNDYPSQFNHYKLTNQADLMIYPQGQRHVFPPKTSEEMAERHGMFDVSGPIVLSQQDYGSINGRPQGIKDLDFPLDRDASGATAPIPVDDKATTETSIQIPYLPDVLARGVAFASLPGDPPVDLSNPPHLLQPYLSYSGWPFVKPFRIRLNGLPNSDPLTSPTPTRKPRWDPHLRILDLYLTQGETWTMHMSSFFHPVDLPFFGMWTWIRTFYAKQGSNVPISLQHQALYGLFWMLSPWRTVTLVHAVQRPLVQPAWDTLVAVKENLGQTWADLENRHYSTPGTGAFTQVPVPVHGKSTMKLDVYGAWQMPIDDGIAARGFYMISSHDHVVEVPVQVDDTGVAFTLNRREPSTNRKHRFHDTKYRKVAYTATATTRFREYFGFSDDDITNNANASITQTSDPAIVHVPNSKRPDAPKVLYVVPAFEWDTAGAGGTHKRSARHGGWLRVWMDRPWYSSGAGEQLGVVIMALHDTANAERRAQIHSPSAEPTSGFMARVAHRIGVGPKPIAVPPELQKYVTQWGRDLAWMAAPINGSPTADAFPQATFIPPDDARNSSNIRFSNLSLDEVAGALVAVAPHDVHFDADEPPGHHPRHTGRKLWYCDIKVDFGEAYYPFVRLALARYQPRSIDGAHLSRVVQADFVQLTPDRFATIQSRFDPKDPRKVSVSVVGQFYSDSPSGPPASQMEVGVEEQLVRAKDDLAWVPVPNATYQLSPMRISNDQWLWHAEFGLSRPSGTVPYRLVIKEYEQYVVGMAFRGHPPQYGRRLVYATAVNL